MVGGRDLAAAIARQIERGRGAPSASTEAGDLAAADAADFNGFEAAL